MNTNVTVIIPIKELKDQSEKDYFANAIASIKEQEVLPEKVLLVIPKGSPLKEEFNNYEFDENVKELISVEENDGETDFCSQINFGVSKVETEFFSVLEFDDIYSSIWFKNFEVYKEHYKDVDVFLPLVVDVSVPTESDPQGRFLHFSNEPVWAKDFSDRIGFLDNDSLLNYPNFQIDGAIINKESFESVGGLKPGIVMYFNYELLLRMTYYDMKIMTIPKVGYKKVNMRPGALFWSYQNDENLKLDPTEARFWYNTARKECYFKQDRGIKYEVKETA